MNADVILPWVPETFLARFPVLSILYSDPREFPLHASKTSGTQGNVILQEFQTRLYVLYQWGLIDLRSKRIPRDEISLQPRRSPTFFQ